MPANKYSDSLLMDALRGSLSNAESFGRGFGVAPVGLLGDVNALAREYITPRLPANVQGLLQSMPSAPTTESILSAIPRMTAPRMESSGIEQIGAAANPRGPINLGRAVVSLPSDIQRAGMEYLQASAQPRQIFVGENSKGWDKINAIRAQAMEKIGIDPKTIWQETGTFRGPEGKLRQEISDENLNINDYRNTGGAISISHPELQASYEQLPRGVKVNPNPQYVEMASYEAPKRELDWQLGEGGTITVPANEAAPLDVYAHELQHAVQAKEGFARGGSPDKMVLVLEDLAKQKRVEARKYFDLSVNNDPLNPQIIKPSARQKGLDLEKEARQLEDKAMLAYHSEQAKFDLYNQLAGEAEARLAQTRLNLTPEQRLQYFPLEKQSAQNPYGLDINPSEMIVRKGLLSP